MTEYKFNNANIRIKGSYDLDNVKSAAEKFLKKVERKRKNEEKNNAKTA